MNKTGVMRKFCDLIHITLCNMVRLGVVKRHRVGKTQTWQIETVNGEIVENAKHLEQYGITSRAPEGSETLIFNVQGCRTNNIVLNIGNRELRFKELNEGEVAIYDNSGNLIHLKNGGNIELTASQTVTINSKTAVITAETTTINGKVNLAGGGAGIARLGDKVKVDPNTHEGTITSASTEVTSA